MGTKRTFGMSVQCPVSRVKQTSRCKIAIPFMNIGHWDAAFGADCLLVLTRRFATKC